MVKLSESEDSQKSEQKVDSTLSKGLRVLEALADSPDGKGVTELARELGMTKSNAFRLLRSLSILGYVQSRPDRNYAPTMKIWQLGQQVVNHLNLPRIAAPQLRQLSQVTGETVYLAVRDGLMVIYIDKIDSSKPIRSFTPKGGSSPIHCVGTGKALLAAEYELLREQVRYSLTQYTPKTIVSMDQLDQDMQATRDRGYAIDTGEYRDRIHSFGATICLPSGQAIAALGVSAPDVNIEGGRDQEICQAVCQAAAEVSEKLGNM